MTGAGEQATEAPRWIQALEAPPAAPYVCRKRYIVRQSGVLASLTQAPLPSRAASHASRSASTLPVKYSSRIPRRVSRFSISG